MSTRTPIVLCGVTPYIGRGVIAALKPEYEAFYDKVIHFISTTEEGAASIPRFLKGQTPTVASGANDDNIGSGNYSKPPVAIVLGSGYGDADVKIMRDACARSSGNEVPWLRPDLSKRTPLLFWQYGKHMTGRVKECLAELEREGKMEKGGVVMY